MVSRRTTLKKGAWKIASVLAMAGLVTAYSVQRGHGNPARPAAISAVPVVVTTVERRNLSVELKGIGTVQAYNTVVVKAQVSGKITEVIFSEGQFVRQGTVLARIDPRYLLAQLHQSEANQAKDEAQLANAQRDLARLSDVAAKGYVSRQLVDAQQSQVSVLQAAIKADQAAVENAQVQLDYATVRAPIDGVTGIRMVDVGNIITPTDPGLVVITQVRPITVIFTLPADIVSTVSMGQARGQLPVEVYDRTDNIELASGTLALIDNQIDRGTNTVRLKAVFDNTEGALRPGQFVNAHLRKTELPDAVTVPKEVIQHDEQGAFVWLVHSDSTVAPQRVVVGARNGGFVSIEHGVSPGDRVVVDGQYNLRAGALVSAQTRQSAPTAARDALSIP